jgi:hypothetical protein
MLICVDKEKLVALLRELGGAESAVIDYEDIVAGARVDIADVYELLCDAYQQLISGMADVGHHRVRLVERLTEAADKLRGAGPHPAPTPEWYRLPFEWQERLRKPPCLDE